MEIEKFESLITSSFGTSYGNVPKGMKSYFDKPIQIKISANIIEKEEKWKERRRGEMKNEKEKQAFVNKPLGSCVNVAIKIKSKAPIHSKGRESHPLGLNL